MSATEFQCAPFFTGAWSPCRFKFAGNLYWDYAKPAPAFPIVKTFAPQQQHEPGALLADPRFEKSEARNFRLAPDSPAVGAGFRPLDPASAGRKSARRSLESSSSAPWPPP